MSARPSWRDLGAGVSVAGVLLPEAIAYAGIAGVPPAHALLAALLGLCIYPLLGSSRFAVVAPTSSAAAVFASTAAQGGAGMAYALVLLTGLMFLLAAGLRAGFLGAFISRPVLRGFSWALALTITVRQLPLWVQVHGEGGNVGALLLGLWRQQAHWHMPSLALGVGATLLWLVLHHGLQKRWPALPTSLLVLLMGVAASHGLGLAEHGVTLVGSVDLSLPHWQVPELDKQAWLRIAELAPALLLILFAESWGSVRSLAVQTGDAVSADRELWALGASNLASGLLQGLPVGAGFSAATASQSAGSVSKWAGLAAAAALALVLGLAPGGLALLPLPVLAGVMVGILSHALWPSTLIASLRKGGDAWLGVIAALGVLGFGVLFGMLLATALSMLMVLRRFARPMVSELGCLAGGHDFVDRRIHPEALAVPQVLVVRPEEPLFFANAEQALQSVERHARDAQARQVVLSLELTDELDSTSCEALGEHQRRLGQIGATLLLARLKDSPRETLQRYWAGQALTPPAAFWSVADAVQAAKAQLR
jgi:MFS superfamily sulfate permease-like transporter